MNNFASEEELNDLTDEQFCILIMSIWMTDERTNQDPTIHDDKDEESIIKSLLTPRMLLRKFEVFGVDIVLPDGLLAMIAFCSNDNPGQSQVILKDLLYHIKKEKGPIPKGYVVKTEDFAHCYPENPPLILTNEKMRQRYELLWDEQKKPCNNINSLESDNLCDTPEWWLEVMEE